MAKSYIDELRGLGATEKELKELRQLQQQFENEDLYTKIEQENKRVLGEAIRPAEISYETAYNSVKYGAVGNVSQYNQSYKEEAKAYKSGTTVDINQSYESMVDTLNDMGLDITVDELRDIRENNPTLYGYIEQTANIVMTYRERGMSDRQIEDTASFQERMFVAKAGLDYYRK